VRVPIVFFLILISSYAKAAEFKYHLEMKPEGYRLGMDMDFGPAVTLAQVIFNLNDPGLFPRLNSTMLPSKISNRHDDTYEMITSFKVAGWKAQMLFNCNEQAESDSYHRRCSLDVPRLNASLFMDAKSDEVTCSQIKGQERVHCHFDVAGKIKSVLFLKSETLTLKAKYQALLNWGKFWYFTQQGSSSARFSNELFDRSDFKKDIDDFLVTAPQVRDGKFNQQDAAKP
jgi:hypothetical protein